MGEKGNITSDELAALQQQASAPTTPPASAAEAVTSVVVNEAGVTVTQAGESLRDKLIDKGADAAVQVVVGRVSPEDRASEADDSAADGSPRAPGDASADRPAPGTAP